MNNHWVTVVFLVFVMAFPTWNFWRVAVTRQELHETQRMMHQENEIAHDERMGWWKQNDARMARMETQLKWAQGEMPQTRPKE